MRTSARMPARVALLAALTTLPAAREARAGAPMAGARPRPTPTATPTPTPRAARP